MQNLVYLLGAFTSVWALVFFYVLWLTAKEGKLRQEIELLKTKTKDYDIQENT